MSFQAYLDNVQTKTGKSAAEFVAMAKKNGFVEFREIIAWLKDDYGLGLGHARAIAHVIRHGAVTEKPSRARKTRKRRS